MSTAQQQKNYRQNKVIKTLFRNNQLTDIGKSALSILKELVRTANSNIIIGDTLMLIGTDLLYRGKIIDIPTLVSIFSLILGLDLADATIEDVSDLLSVLHGNSPHSKLGTSATTIVYADGKDEVGTSSLAPLLSLLGKSGTKGTANQTASNLLKELEGLI